jgi:hypothetical protein
MIKLHEEAKMIKAVRSLRSNPKLSIHHHANEHGVNPEKLHKVWGDTQKKKVSRNER